MEQLQLSLELDTVTDKMALLTAGLRRDRMGILDRLDRLAEVKEQINKDRENGTD